MALTLYYGSGSPFAWKVWLALEHKAVSYRLERLFFDKEEHKSPAFLAINPRGKLPAITDDDVALYESASIVEYLEDRYPERPLLPGGPAQRAQQRRIAAEVDNYLYPAQSTLTSLTIQRRQTEPDLAAIEAAQRSLIEELTRWDRALKGDYFGGGAPLLADYAAYPVLRSVLRIDEKTPQHGLGSRFPASLKSYVARMEALPYVSKTTPPHWMT